MTALRVYNYFFKVLFLKFFSDNAKYNIALDTLFNSHSYRIPNHLSKQKAPFIYFMKSIRLLFAKNTSTFLLKPANEAMYCTRPYHAEFCVKYAAMLNLKTENINVIVRDTPIVSHLNFFDKLMIVIMNSFICLYSFLASFFKKESNKLSLITLELVESVVLLKNLQKYGTSYLYYFSSYEKDANWIALLLQHNHIYCHKIPSSNPIKNFYPKVLADKFSFTAPFQKDEYPGLKHQWIVNEFDMWPNLGSQNLAEFTIERKGSAPDKSIGIFTRGIWLRKLRGDNFLGVGEDEAEVEMLDFIKEFLAQHKEINTVYMLLHPTEKSTNEQYDRSKKYYTDLFGTINLIFVDSKQPSYELFNLFDVGVASLSSVIFERLHCGYKCLLAPIRLKVKLYEDKNLENIIANTKEEFFIKLKEVVEISNEEYFSNYQLSDYRLNSIKEINV